MKTVYYVDDDNDGDDFAQWHMNAINSFLQIPVKGIKSIIYI